MEQKFADYSNICWATLVEVARTEFSADRQVDVYLDYRFWNDLKLSALGVQVDLEAGCMVYLNALNTGLQVIRVFVGSKNRVQFLNKVVDLTGTPNRTTKVVEIVGFPIRD